MKKILVVFLLIFFTELGFSQDKITVLHPGDSIVQTLHKGDNHKYRIRLNEGDFCKLIVMQKGVDVVVDLSDPLFKIIQSYDTPNGNNGPEMIEFTAEKKGSYKLSIYPLNDYTGMSEKEKEDFIVHNQGNYEISSVSVMSRKDYDKMFAGENLRKKKFVDSLNLGFEKITANKKIPDNWFEFSKPGNDITIDSTVKHGGRNSVKMQRLNTDNPFVSIGLGIPSNFEGNEIELRAYMKMNNVSGGPIGLMIRLDGISGTLEFDNMEQKNIQGTSDWTLYSVKVPYPKETKKIYIAAILSGTGQLWVDDFQILIDGKDLNEAKFVEQKIYKAEADKEFDNGSKIVSIDPTESNINNLTILGKIWGFLKYYHPAIAKGDYNWDYELFRVMPKILSAKNEDERNGIISNWITGLGSTDTQSVKKGDLGEVKLSPDLTWIEDSGLGERVISQLENVRDAKRLNENYYIGKVEGVGNPEFKNENPYKSMNYPDAGFRILALYRYWNMINYFYPNKLLADDNWNDVLKKFIPKFISSADGLEYKLNLLTLIGSIQDSHAGIYGDSTLENFKGKNFAPVQITFIEDKAVVTDLLEKDPSQSSVLKTGDIIESINNKTVSDVVAERLEYYPASNYPTQLRNIAVDLLRTNDSKLTVEYLRDGETMTSEVNCFPADQLNIYKRYSRKDTCFKFIDPEIAYLYPGTIKNEYLPQIMPEVLKTKGLIIDLRCYPSEFIVFSLSEYLQHDPANFVRFSKGNILTPGLFTISNNLQVGNKSDSSYKGKIVIIVNEETQSQAEYTTMAFRTAPNATVIGSTTAGADGNVSSIILPGAVKTWISGIGVYYPDGRETQRIGIIPDIEVKPTIKGFSEGRDEVLEKAIEIIDKPGL